MIPRWKIAREIDRAGQQLKAVVGLFWEPVAQWRYDRNRSKALAVFSGKVKLNDRIAIYLLYQPGGLRASTIETCALLEKSGYSVLAVSNAPLSDRDRAALVGCCWRVIERPNYGYDFGGYRDGILHLLESEIQPQRLVVVNDSIWFPLSASDDLLQRIDASQLDLAETIVHRSMSAGGLRRRKAKVIESYFFSFSARAVAHPAFRAFWRKYRMSSNKLNAVYRGERKVAEVMLAAGLSADGLFGREEFLAAIAGQSEDFLRKTLTYASYNDDGLSDESKALLAQGRASEGWSARALDHIARASLKRNFHGAFVFATIRLLDIPVLKVGGGTFLKKSYSTLYSGMRARYLEAVAANDLPAPRPAILAEIQAAHNATQGKMEQHQ